VAVKFGKLRTTMAQLGMTTAMRAAGLRYAKDLAADEVTDLRIIGPLFRILDRRPLDPDGLEHLADSVVARASSIRASRLVAASAYYLCDEAVSGYQEIGRGLQKSELEVHAPAGLVALRDSCGRFTDGTGQVRGDTMRLLTLWSSLANRNFLAADPDVVAAIARSVGSACTRPLPASGALTPSTALALAAHVALERGHEELAQRLASQLSQVAESDGYRAIAGMIYAPAVRTGTDEEYLRAITAANEAAYRLSAADPARDMAISMAEEKVRQWTDANDGLLVPSQRSFHEGVRLLRDGDRDGAAIALDAAANHAARGTGEPVTDAFYRGRAATLAFSCRFHSIYDSPDYPSADLAKLLGALASHDFASAREQYPSSDHLRNVLKYCAARSNDESYAWLAAITAELRGEYDGGIAVGREEISRDARDLASRELAVKDLLTGFIQLPARRQLLDLTRGRTVVWVSEVIDHDEQAIISVMLRPGDTAPRVFPTVLRSDRGRSIIRRAAAAQLSDYAADSAAEIASLREWIFRQEAVSARPVLIIPDRRLWCLPWGAIVPPEATTVTLAPSLSATARITRHATRTGVPVIAGIFDSELQGAREELKALAALHAADKVVLQQAASLSELEGILADGPIDLLTIATHGTSGDGFEYRLLFPESDASPAGLLGLPLPPNMVLGCCWSARQGTRADGLATALACMSAGASTVVGALWDVNDWLAGKILASAYPDFAAGMNLAQAVRAAYLRRREAVTGSALAVLGLPD
jgi:CHAT domain